MNSTSSLHQPHGARRARVSSQTWDEFAAPRRARDHASRVASFHGHAAIPHAHLTFADTPDLYLREEMA